MQRSVRGGGQTAACEKCTRSPEGSIALVTVKEIFDLVRDDLVRVEQELAEQTSAASEPVGEIARYLLGGGGKRLRPALLLLSAGYAGYRGPAAVHLGAVVDRNGAEQPLAAPAQAYVNPRLSPDGQRVAVGITEPEFQTWLYDLSREALTRFTSEGSLNSAPLWTPDGKRIAFRSKQKGPPEIYWQKADGSGGLERLTTGSYNQVPMSWSRDGQLLAFVEINPTSGYDIWVLRMNDRKAQLFLQTPFNESVPRFSPDGRWLAYISDESGRYEIYVKPYPGPGGKWQISTEGGTEPTWNTNGRELFYRSGDKMMAVDIATQTGFVAGKPRVLFERQYVPTPGTNSNYDVSPDGQRFLMLKPSEQAQAAPTQINVVLNWFEELKQKVPTGKKQ